MKLKSLQTDCSSCKKATHQKILYEKKKEVESGPFKETVLYMVLECGGCQEISFLMRQPDMSALPDEPQYIDYNYPHAGEFEILEFNFLRPEDEDELPPKIMSLYDEVKTACKGGSNLLAATGLRMLIEAVCSQQKIPGNNLKEKIESLHKHGKISGAELPILDKLRLLGNQSAHEARTFSTEALSYAVDIINHALKSIYILPKVNKRLKVIPMRKTP